MEPELKGIYWVVEATDTRHIGIGIRRGLWLFEFAADAHRHMDVLKCECFKDISIVMKTVYE